MRKTENDSSGPSSSITDSQHLLDADAQALELEETRRALAPLPLRIIQSRNASDMTRDNPYDDSTGYVLFDSTHAQNPFNHPEDNAHLKDDDYMSYLKPGVERDISCQLERLSGIERHDIYSEHIGIPNIEVVNATQPDSDDENSRCHPIRPHGKIFSRDSLLTTGTGERPIRHITVNIGRDSQVTGNDENYHESFKKVKDDRNLAPEDADWVTEATSDVGFGHARDTVPDHLTLAYKKTGSSIADYSDNDGEGHSTPRFGSRELIIQHPTAEDRYVSYDVQRCKDFKFPVMLPRRHNGFPENTNRRWASTGQQEPAQFRPLPKSSNPFRAPNSKRPDTGNRLPLNFALDRNAHSKYEFRDSTSEYEPAMASTEANYGTHATLPSPILDAGEDNHPSTTDAHFDRSADFDADRNPSNRASECQEMNLTTSRAQWDMKKMSMHSADNPAQVADLDKRKFAALSSYYDPPSSDSVRSKFEFELIPLHIAKRKNKQQRDSGETNETETAAARLKRKQSGGSDLPEPPTKAFFTSRDLSIDFSPPNWDLHDLDLEGMLFHMTFTSHIHLLI